MFRKLILASAVSLALLPGGVGALELGGIRTESALNEPFSGRIDLLDAKPDELASVKVALASKAEFDRVGAPRSDFLGRLSFKPGVSPQGQAIIEVTSKDPVREPYLDFLIEVTWPKGRLVKEYTVLLDPPVTLDRPAPAVEQPALAAPEPKPRQITRSAPPSPPKPSEPAAMADASAFPMRYGPVEPGAGLWRIARKMAKSSGASVAQMAMALYRNNQQAFIRGDINKLKVGKVLQIPTAAELAALDTGAAKREFQAALRGEKVTTTPITDIKAAPAPEDRLTIAGAAEPVTAPEAAPEAPPEAPEDTSEAAVSGAASDAEPELGTLKQDLLLVQETSESTRQETEELRDRIHELETQLADIQRLLKLSNERFAQLQVAGLDQPDVTDVEATDLPLPVTPGETVEPVAESEIAEIPAEPSPPAEPIPEQPETAPEPQPEAETAAPDQEKAPKQESAPPAFWESIPQSMWTAAAAVPVLLLLLAWMIRRRRKSLEESLRPLDLEAAAPEAASAMGFGESEPETQELVASSDVSPSTGSPYSGFGNLEDETEEADIISEADVYIAYGRYREAESLLEEEVGKAPDRLDIKFKLAEAYYGARNLDGMRTLKKELQESGADQSNPDQWVRFNSMLGDLEGPGAARPAPTVVAPREARPTEPVLPLKSSFVPPPPAGGDTEPLFTATTVAPDVDATVTVPAPGHDSQEPLSHDLELEVEDLDVITSGLETPANGETLEMSGAASDLELQLEDLESLRDLDLGGLSDQVSPFDRPSTQTPVLPVREAKSNSVDIAPVGKDSLASDVLSSQWQMDSGMWDEVATKIDLARAYMEMEDPEAARVILEEVAQEGNEEQRTEAQEMLAQLG